MLDLSSIQTLAREVLSALGPSQSNRLLRLHTPLGEDVLLAERMLCHEAIGPGAPGMNVGFRLELLLLGTDPALFLKTLIGQPVRLDLLTQEGLAAPRCFHGLVTQFARLGSDGGLSRYRAVVEPWAALMDHRRDSWVFQDKTVVEIIEEVFADYRDKGGFVPAWRWELADPDAYPRRSICMQYQESDLHFVQRLMREEGLFGWFEHEGDLDGGTGRHVWVLADHNGGFESNAQPVVRFTRTNSASFDEDSLTVFDESASVVSTSLSVSSWDYRSVQQFSADIPGDATLVADGLALPLRDQPGAYAYESGEQAERIAQRQLQAIQASASQYRARGPFRQAAPGTSIRIAEHPAVDPQASFVTLAVQHRARNNISSALHTSLARLLGDIPPSFERPSSSDDGASDPAGPARTGGDVDPSSEPIYEARLLLQDVDTPVRAPALLQGPHGDPLFARPRVAGCVTAIVVGLDGPVHTDRDLRVKIQFHWQRGDSASHRLDHPSGSNAPASDASGTWVRVAHAWAGANWGAHHPPRLGQEVLVAFVEGDPDRPIVVGSVYNGRGQPDDQGNGVTAGAATATGNAPHLFPEDGSQGAGHGAVLAGFKTQSLEASQDGGGGYNQLAFDDTPGQSRILLHSRQGRDRSTWFQIGHLLHQDDNRRLDPRGYGLDLASTDQGALRAGSGLYLSTHAAARGTNANAQPSDARAALAELERAAEQAQALADTAQKQNAGLSGEAAAKELPVVASQQRLMDSQRTTDEQAAAEADDAAGHDASGGIGKVAAPGDPDLLLHGVGGIAALTPLDAVHVAGDSTGWVAGHDIDLNSQRHLAVVANRGVSLFTFGKIADTDKPNTETGMQLHAASGSVSLQSQQGPANLTARQAIEVFSTGDAVNVASPKQVLLAAGGSALRIDSDGITLTTPGTAPFNASMKVLTSGASANAKYAAMPGSSFGLTFQLHGADGAPLKHRKVKLIREDGSSRVVELDADGKTPLIDTDRSAETIRVQLADREQWGILADEHHTHDDDMACCTPRFHRDDEDEDDEEGGATTSADAPDEEQGEA